MVIAPGGQASRQMPHKTHAFESAAGYEVRWLLSAFYDEGRQPELNIQAGG